MHYLHCGGETRFGWGATGLLLGLQGVLRVRFLLIWTGKAWYPTRSFIAQTELLSDGCPETGLVAAPLSNGERRFVYK